MAHLRARPVLRTGGIEGGHVEAKAVRETNGCGTEWRESGSRKSDSDVPRSEK